MNTCNKPARISPISGVEPVSHPFTSSKSTTGCGALTSRNTAACTSTPSARSADAGREIEVRRVGLADLEPLREEYRRAAGCQIVHDSALPRGLADPYLLLVGGEVAAYAGIWSRYYPGRVMEFHTQRPMGPGGAERLFDALLAATGATHVEAQSNMPLMLAMLRARGANVVEEKVLFEDGPGTDLRCPGAVLRPSSRDERLEGEFALDVDGVVVAHGGILCHYNPPYGDLYMEVAEGARIDTILVDLPEGARVNERAFKTLVKAAVAGARSFRKERSGVTVAKYTWPGRHRFLISKKPSVDELFIPESRAYAEKV